METHIQLELQPIEHKNNNNNHSINSRRSSNSSINQDQDAVQQEQTPNYNNTITIPSRLPTSSSGNSIHEVATLLTPQTPKLVLPTVTTPTTPTTPTTTATAGTSRQLFRDAAAAHGGLDSLALMQHEQKHIASTQLPKVNSDSSMVDATVSRNPSTTGGRQEKKIGHRRVAEGGEVTYKKIQSKQIMGSIQLGIQHTVGSLASKPKRDLLMNDFFEMETIAFPPDGSSLTPAHHYSDFRFKVYAPMAFRYFRDLFNIEPDDFLMSMCATPMRELSNPGASGSIFYLTDDDAFIIKTVQKKECEFLQKLLPGYYMNLSQNPRTLLPKFFGLYCFHYNSKNVRLVAMNNLLPSDIKMHVKYDLKGSTFRRKASKAERQKASPTYKDLDFAEHHPNGIFLEAETYTALMNTIKRDCMVLESFQIMDYSLLVGIHNLDTAAKEKEGEIREERILNARAKLQRREGAGGGGGERGADDDASESADNLNQLQPVASYASIPGTSAAGLNRTRSMNRQRLVAHSTAMESITEDLDGGIPARSENDERLMLYIGIIDILQSYRLEKKLEHTFKSILYNGDTVSVCRPSFYAKRFQEAMGKQVFKKTPTFKHSPSKRKTSSVTTTPLRTPLARPSNAGSSGGGGVGGGSNSGSSNARGVNLNMLSGMSTPPPAFDDISEEDITAGASSTTPQQRTSGTLTTPEAATTTQHFQSPFSYASSMRSTSDFSDDDEYSARNPPQHVHAHATTNGISSILRTENGGRNASSLHRIVQLSKTSVQVTTVGYVEDDQVEQEQEHEDKEKLATQHSVEANGKPPFLQAPSYKTTLLLQAAPE